MFDAQHTPAHDLDDLARAAKHGDRVAAQELMRRLDEKLRPIVGHIAKSLARNVLVEADIEDIMQDVMLAVWRCDVLRHDERRAGFMTFVSRRLRWHVVDALRVRARHEADPITEELAELLVDDAKDPRNLIASVVREQVLDDLEKNLDRALGDDDDARVAIRRCDVEGATLAEVAKEMGRHTTSAWRARQRGLKLLARRVEALAA